MCIYLCVYLCAVWYNVCLFVWQRDCWLCVSDVPLATGAERCWHCLQRDTVQESKFIYLSLSSSLTLTHRNSEKQTKMPKSCTDTQKHSETNMPTNRQINILAHNNTHLGGVWDLRHLAKVNRGNCQPWHFMVLSEASQGDSFRWVLVGDEDWCCLTINTLSFGVYVWVFLCEWEHACVIVQYVFMWVLVITLDKVEHCLFIESVNICCFMHGFLQRLKLFHECFYFFHKSDHS